ncbi:hypothetical protein L9F63_019906 [Diploptera punctata]|uniref:Selenoprotein W n=1 Tax=Diploptera punctata TaxID=6984 RepID=A0AAD7ZUQ6_DIPPU|nr:hypothetical protein L9F63_019906 [Diploptera punctata]
MDVKVEVEYCGGCGYLPRYEQLKEQIKSTVPTAEVVGKEGRTAGCESGHTPILCSVTRCVVGTGSCALVLRSTGCGWSWQRYAAALVLRCTGAVGPGSVMLRLSSSGVQGAVGPGSVMLQLSSSDVQGAVGPGSVYAAALVLRCTGCAVSLALLILLPSCSVVVVAAGPGVKLQSYGIC